MIINGRNQDIGTPISVEELITSRGLRPDRVAVEVNGSIVPRTAHAQTTLSGTDTVEIVTFVQGG
ncbi:ThiS protein [Bifidobacterium minimum]|jgi:sulfur carrier protein|uniref:ThiS protein n=1 Tax=Bifidobacterium minimum TaxID=1693 RepID=A0A087BSQ4_9BIFI|nr:sulfur carrier protein ThiS [Bifidobacterium minimum]KFI74054.1 ThiS protein [Bifidobacterium minimum]